MDLSKTVVAVDIDGTLTNDIQIAKDCIHMWNTHVNFDPERSVYFNPKSVDLIRFPPYLNKTEFYDYTSTIHKKPIVDGFTIAAMRGIQSLGCKIVIITRRQIGFADYSGGLPRSETKKWLQDSGVSFDTLVCTNDTAKSPFLQRYNCKYIIENNPKILVDLRNYHCRTIPILLRKPYNRPYEISFKDKAVFIDSIYDFYVYLGKNQTATH